MLTNIDETLDHWTDLIFGEESPPDEKLPVLRVDIFKNELPNVRVCTRYNGHLEKEVFYQNLRVIREQNGYKNDLFSNGYIVLKGQKYSILEEYKERFIDHPEKRDYIKILREQKANVKK